MKKLALASALALCCILCSCTQYSQGGYEFDAGETLDIGGLESMFETTSQEAESAPVDTPNEEPSETEPNESEPIQSQRPPIGEITTVYWTKSGTKYHIYRDCQSLKKSTDILSGTIEEAKENKKAECCKYCEDDFNGGK